jgi:hypothetical protein
LALSVRAPWADYSQCCCYAAPLAAGANAGFAMPKIEMLYQTLHFLDENNRQLHRVICTFRVPPFHF